MKPEYEKIVEPPGRSFTVRSVNRPSRPRLSQAWHFHPEVEICYTLTSRGRRFVGNQISTYEEGDLVMFGSNLPHGFTTDVTSRQIVIQMMPDFLGRAFIQAPELYPVRTLFERSLRGLEFRGPAKRRAIRVIEQLLDGEGMPQLLLLFELLSVLVGADEATPLCPEDYVIEAGEAHFGRMRVVYDHVMEHYRGDVRVGDVAAKLNLSESAFYTFIKRSAKKTYTQIVNEFRIHHACKLLMSTDLPIHAVCFDSGYN
ncbi:MAG: AraC family transcriptional regulator, partial [Bacteroidota bacterium]